MDGPSWTMSSAARFGVRFVSYSGGGRRGAISSLAPERHWMPIRISSPSACEVSVTSATSVRSNRLRSLSEVDGAAHNAGRSAANASSSSRGGSMGTFALTAASPASQTPCHQAVLSTHYHELAALQERCGQITLLQAAVAEGPDGITFPHRI